MSLSPGTPALPITAGSGRAVLSVDTPRVSAADSLTGAFSESSIPAIEATATVPRRVYWGCIASVIVHVVAMIAAAWFVFDRPPSDDALTLMLVDYTASVASEPPKPPPIMIPPPAEIVADNPGPAAPSETAAAKDAASGVTVAARSAPAAAPPTVVDDSTDRAVAAVADNVSETATDEMGETEQDWTGWSGIEADGGGAVRPIEYHGIKCEGRRLVYIVDASGSMRGQRFEDACNELLYSIDNLGPLQEFAVFFFNDHRHTRVFPEDGRLIAATAENKRQLREWTADVRPQGDTHPTVTVRRALRLKPEIIFFLSDGEIPLNTVRVAKADNHAGEDQAWTRDPPAQTVIHTIGFNSRDGEELLMRMATENDGEYHFVP